MDVPFMENKQTHFDFLIIGQGIAGSTLALTLIEKGYSVCVIDKPSLSTCSSVAAGIWNPVVFKRLVKSWKADQVLPYLVQFYERYESQFKCSLITKRQILKPFSETQESELWLKKSKVENHYLQQTISSQYQLSSTQNLNSYAMVLEAGNLNVTEFLNQTRLYLLAKFSYIEDLFSHDDVTHTSLQVKYKHISANHLVFCEGHLVSKNSFFDWVPTKPAKGEVITIACDDLNLDLNILNKGIFILPLGNSIYKVGATYEWKNLTDDPTPEGLMELETKLRMLITSPFKIINHEAGIRPSVIDRRPVIGSHPSFKNIHVFNGFGTKAVMLAPYYANQFVNQFQQKEDLDDEVNVSRFY
jgi:glycine/D-amino acid oxidase-like deaminating enzyme